MQSIQSHVLFTPSNGPALIYLSLYSWMRVLYMLDTIFKYIQLAAELIVEAFHDFCNLNSYSQILVSDFLEYRIVRANMQD